MNNLTFKLLLLFLCAATIIPVNNKENKSIQSSLLTPILFNGPIKKTQPEVTETITKSKDVRALKLQKYLESKNSPLASQANAFVRISDKYEIDYTLLPAISGIESSFGIHLMPNSHNPFGWGGGHIYYDSWEECIESVAKGIANNYPSDIPEEIGPIYTPPNYVKWIAAVKQFQTQILNTEI